MSEPREGSHAQIKRLALLAHSGKGNLGDEATMAEVIRNIKLRQPDAEIRAFTLNPEDTQERHKVRAHPLRCPREPGASPGSIPPLPEDRGSPPEGPVDLVKRQLKRVPVLGAALRGLNAGVRAIPACFSDLAFLFESSRRLKGVDLLVVAGGGQLGDYFGGAWGFPYSIFRWSLMSRFRGARVAFLSVGAGPIRSPLSRLFFRRALSTASYRSFRDEGSRRLIESLGVAADNHVFPDLVHGLPAEEPDARVRGAAGVIGINPLPYQDSRYWAEDDEDVYKRYVEKLAAFADWLIEAGYNVLLFPTQVAADVPVVQDVEAMIRSRRRSLPAGRLDCPQVRTLDELTAVISQTDLVVASRFHGVVISLLMNRPVIGLSYDKKTDELMADVGMGDYVSDIHGFESDWLISRFQRLWGEADAAVARIEARRATYRAALDDQYDLLFGPPRRVRDASEPHSAPERTCVSTAEAGA